MHKAVFERWDVAYLQYRGRLLSLQPTYLKVTLRAGEGM